MPWHLLSSFPYHGDALPLKLWCLLLQPLRAPLPPPYSSRVTAATCSAKSLLLQRATAPVAEITALLGRGLR